MTDEKVIAVLREQRAQAMREFAEVPARILDDMMNPKTLSEKYPFWFNETFAQLPEPLIVEAKDGARNHNHGKPDLQ